MDGMNETFKRKMQILTHGQALSEVEAKTGVKAQTIYDAREKGSVPRASTLSKIAKAYKKPLSWLADDGEPSEPVPTSRLDDPHVRDVELLAATSSRYRKHAQAIADQITEAEQIDWSAVKSKLEAVDKARDVPPDVASAVELLNALWLAATSRLGMFWMIFHDGNEGLEMVLPETVGVRSDSLELPHMATRIARMRRVVGSTEIGRELLYAGMTGGVLSGMTGRSVRQHDSGVTVAKVDPEQSMRRAMDAYREAGGAFVNTPK